MKHRLFAYFAMLSLLVLVVGSVTGPAAAAPGGNSDNAHACQQGGWQALARSEDPGTAFLNQDECVSYGAQGGTIVEYEPVVLNPAIHVSAFSVGAYDLWGYQWCGIQVDLVDFAPNTEYPLLVEISYYGGSPNESYSAPQLTNDDGDWSGTPIGTYYESGIGYNWVRATANGITTEWYDIEC
jgi:hypothetical protein